MVDYVAAGQFHPFAAGADGGKVNLEGADDGMAGGRAGQREPQVLVSHRIRSKGARGGR